MKAAGVSRRWVVGVLCGWVIVLNVACTPELNWRVVQLGRLSALLPCKPDRATRLVQLADTQLPMEMVGCESAGGMVAMSHVRLESGQKVEEVVKAWRESALRNMQSRVVKDLPQRSGVAVFLQATGSQADGSAVQAHLAWIADGSDVFHVASYSPKASPDLVDTLFTELKLQ